MKKLILLMLMVVSMALPTIAQNDTIIYIENQPPYVEITVCPYNFDRVVIYAVTGSTDFWWRINGQTHYENPIIINSEPGEVYDIIYAGANNFVREIFLDFPADYLHLPNPITQTIWKHQGESIMLQPVGNDSIGEPYWYEYLWSTGETEAIIEISNPGTYTCEMSVRCGSVTRTFIVQDNVEIELATCDLVTNLNMVTWQTTPAQAQYIDHVIVKRDGLNVGTANYSEGSFLDNIGSDLAQRTYTLTAVATDGTECPIVSYPKETIHMAYLTGVNNTIEVNWNTPTGYDLLGYNICEWTPNGKDGDLRVIDFVGASVTSYTCQASQFTNGYVVIQGVEAGKPESRLLSNHSAETVGVGEYGMDGFKVYPNPANGIFTVEGTGHLTVMNLLGQEILTQEIDGKAILELPKGIYFVRLGSTTRKIVVE